MANFTHNVSKTTIVIIFTWTVMFGMFYIFTASFEHFTEKLHVRTKLISDILIIYYCFY